MLIKKILTYKNFTSQTKHNTSENLTTQKIIQNNSQPDLPCPCFQTTAVLDHLKRGEMNKKNDYQSASNQRAPQTKSAETEHAPCD